LSECNWNQFPAIDLDEREALWYLSGRDFSPGKMPDGHFLVRFKGLALGWSRRHGRSMARSYPTGWRIKMQI
jgi:NOL1/NOP2/fmu family ribosome biogenesis protein